MPDLGLFFRNNLSLRHLRLLVALDDLRSIGRTASFLYVTQPAVSKTLAFLEDGVGHPLFKRTGRSLVPTPEGETLIAHARDILAQLQAAQNDIRECREGKISSVTLGVLAAAAIYLLPQVIARLSEEAASTSVVLREGSLGQFLPLLKSGELDMAMTALPERPLGPEFESEPLFQDPIVVAVRFGHPLLSVPNLQWSDIQRYPLILPPPNTLTRIGIETFLAKKRVHLPRARIESLSTMTNVGVLQQTDAIGLLTRSVTSYFAELGILATLPLEMPDIFLTIGLTRLTTRRVTEAESTIYRLLKHASADKRALNERYA